jgi:hypothetical protein
VRHSNVRHKVSVLDRHLFSPQLVLVRAVRHFQTVDARRHVSNFFYILKHATVDLFAVNVGFHVRLRVRQQP